MADIDGVDEGVAEEAADQADDAVGGQHLGGRKGIPGRRRALDIVHGLDEVIDAEGNRRNQDDPEELESREDVVDGRKRDREAEMRDGVADRAEAEAAIAETEE